MESTSTLTLTNLGHQRRLTTTLNGDLTPEHTVDQTIDFFNSSAGIPQNGLRFVAVSRGRRLDKKSRLRDLPVEDKQWTVLPEATAGRPGA